jgi:hypothetical protein
MAAKYSYEYRVARIPYQTVERNRSNAYVPDPERTADLISRFRNEGFVLQPDAGISTCLLFMRSTRIVDEERVADVLERLPYSVLSVESKVIQGLLDKVKDALGEDDMNTLVKWLLVEA